MPSLFRLVIILSVLVAVGYGIMLALSMVEPRERIMTSSVPSSKLKIEVNDEGSNGEEERD